ncbi:MAG: MATE family efflux transporter [Fusicatenibacter saccharivorans]
MVYFLAHSIGKGLPVAVMNSVTAVGGMVLQVFVNQMGTAYVAAYAACMKVCGLFEQPGITLGLALLTFTGQNYGAGKYDRIKQGVRAGVDAFCPCQSSFCSTGNFLPEASGIPDAERCDSHFLYLYLSAGYRSCLVSPLAGCFVFRNACQGMGKTVLPMVSGIVEVAMRVMVVLLVAPRLAFRGVAFAEISAWVGAGVMLMITYFFIRGGSRENSRM